MSTILLADDHAIIRAGVAAILEPSTHRLVASADSARDALIAVALHDPDICVFDVAMPDMNGIELLRRMRADGDGRPVILLTAQIDDAALLEAWDAGIDGLVSKEGAEETLLAALDTVASGGKAFEPQLEARIEVARTRRSAGGETLSRLTPRERAITQMVARGSRNRDIASELGITEGTVKVYLHTIYNKLDIENRTELAVMVLNDPTWR